MALIRKLTNGNNIAIYPVTNGDAVYIDNGKMTVQDFYSSLGGV